MKSKINGKEFSCGQLETPSLGELKERISAEKSPLEKLSLHEVVADVQQLHTDKSKPHVQKLIQEFNND